MGMLLQAYLGSSVYKSLLKGGEVVDDQSAPVAGAADASVQSTHVMVEDHGALIGGKVRGAGVGEEPDEAASREAWTVVRPCAERRAVAVVVSEWVATEVEKERAAEGAREKEVADGTIRRMERRCLSEPQAGIVMRSQARQKADQEAALLAGSKTKEAQGETKAVLALVSYVFPKPLPCVSFGKELAIPRGEDVGGRHISMSHDSITPVESGGGDGGSDPGRKVTRLVPNLYRKTKDRRQMSSISNLL